jgi:nitrogen fixation protein FixH
MTADLPDLLLHARVDDASGNLLDAHIPVRPDSHGAYRANLQLPPGTWHVRVETVTATPAAWVDDVLVAETVSRGPLR